MVERVPFNPETASKQRLAQVSLLLAQARGIPPKTDMNTQLADLRHLREFAQGSRIRPFGITGYVEDGNLIGVTHTTAYESHGHIDALAVDAKMRERGFGGAILQDTIRRFGTLGLHEVTLQVHKTNESAIRLYESHGFEVVDDPGSYYKMAAVC